MSAPLLGSLSSRKLRPGDQTRRIAVRKALGAGYFFDHLMSDSMPALQSSIAASCLSAALHHGGFGSGLLH
jgi:hypothetical protein